jgi:hypothetical protein
MAIPADVQQQALHPFRDLIPPTGHVTVDRDDIFVAIHPLPIAKLVEPANLRPEEVETAVANARAIIAERGSSLLVWWIAPERASIGEELERLGLVNADTPGFEAVENAMAITEAPVGDPVDDVLVTEVRSFEDFHASSNVSAAAFEMPEEMRDELEATMREQYEMYATPGNSAIQFNASIDGVVVGTAATVRGPAGLNLFGGSVLSEARGRGVYRALTLARWQYAVDLGTPALTIQAGRMSKPIVERLGFTLVGQARIYVDDFSAGVA